MHCSFSFGQLEELLATIHHIAPERRVAFQGRLKHLQRWGFPTREKPGKGRAIAYSIEHVFRAVLALEFIQAGINPKLAIDLVEANWESIVPTVYLNGFTGTERVKFGAGSNHDWCWLVRPEALRGLTGEESEFDSYEAIHAVHADALMDHLVIDSNGFGTALGSHWRNLVINGGSLVRGVLSLIELRLEWASRDEMLADLKAVIDQRNARLHAAMESLGPELSDIAEQVRKDRAKRGADIRPYCDLYPSLIPAARKIVNEANAALTELLLNEDGATVELTNETLRSLADLRLIQITAEELAMTPLFFVASELLKSGEVKNDCNS